MLYQAYEKETMVPAQSNHDVAVATTEEILDMVPNIFGLKNFGRRVTYSLLEERVRVAMMFVFSAALPFVHNLNPYCTYA